MKNYSLNGEWKFREDGKRGWMKASVPGVIHTDLLDLGKIPDPYYGKNELALQWIGQTDWVYKKSFRFNTANFPNDKHLLVCEGLDTIAEVSLNSKPLGKTENTYRRYEFDITNLLKNGNNDLDIKFISPEACAKQEKERHPYYIPRSEVFINYIRKTPCQGGWDWGPRFMTSGIWKDIYIASYDRARIEYVTTEQKHKKDAVQLVVNLFVDSTQKQNISINVSISGVEKSLKKRVKQGKQKISFSMNVPSPDLWYPVGYGKQCLHDLNVEICEGGEKIDCHHSKIGFRKLELVTKKDKWGKSFFFKINDVAVFAKGANWIPADCFLPRVTRERYEKLLGGALSANMNMIRVWGGGIYESEDFYNFCDEKGLLVWQDFTFSCSFYPATDEFLANVRAEAEHQVRRLSNHPSLVLWCGNNECEQGFKWFEDQGEEAMKKLFVDYRKLYIDTIYPVVKEEKPDVPYWTSSPCGGIGVYGKHSDPTCGDIHDWSVWHGGKTFKDYLDVRPRFVSEYGFQSFPSLETLSTCMTTEDFNVTSPVMEHHQKNIGGNCRIVEHLCKEYRMGHDFESFIYLSQLQQARGIRFGTEHWRRLKPLTMGTLYWQLNDIWQVVSWASIEYDGRWKMLNYMAKHFYAPVLISAYDKDDQLFVWITSDKNKPLKGDATIKLRDFSGMVVASKKVRYSLKPLESKQIAKVSLKKLIPSRLSVEEVFATLESEVDGEKIDNLHFLAPVKRSPIERTEVNASISVLKSKIKIRLKSKTCAFFVWLNFGDTTGVFSDNAFSMMPGETKVVEFRPNKLTNLKSVARHFTIKTLRDTY